MSDLQQSTSLVRTPRPAELRPVLVAAGADIDAPDGQPDTLIVRGLRIDEIGEIAFAAGVAMHELSAHPNSLEDLFLQATITTSSPDAAAGARSNPPREVPST